MNIFSGVVVYVLVWWIVFFCTLPFNIQNKDVPNPGNMPGAPDNHHLKPKVIIATIISCFVWLVIYLIIRSDLVSYHDIAQRMAM